MVNYFVNGSYKDIQIGRHTINFIAMTTHSKGTIEPKRREKITWTSVGNAVYYTMDKCGEITYSKNATVLPTYANHQPVPRIYNKGTKISNWPINIQASIESEFRTN